jgi:hypothetical protein
MKKGLLVLLVTAFYALHQDFWNWRSTELVLGGLLPIGLAYHAAYSVLAAILMAVLVRVAWPADVDSIEEPKARAPQEKDAP